MNGNIKKIVHGSPNLLYIIKVSAPFEYCFITENLHLHSPINFFFFNEKKKYVVVREKKIVVFVFWRYIWWVKNGQQGWHMGMEWSYWAPSLSFSLSWCIVWALLSRDFLWPGIFWSWDLEHKIKSRNLMVIKNFSTQRHRDFFRDGEDQTPCFPLSIQPWKVINFYFLSIKIYI